MPYLPLPPPPRLAHVVRGLPGKGTLLPPPPVHYPPRPTCLDAHVRHRLWSLQCPQGCGAFSGNSWAPETPASGLVVEAGRCEIRHHWK